MVYHVTVPENNRIGPCLLDSREVYTSSFYTAKSRCAVYKLFPTLWAYLSRLDISFSIFIKCSAWVLFSHHPVLLFFPFSHNVISLCNLIRLYNYSNKHSWQGEVGVGGQHSVGRCLSLATTRAGLNRRREVLTAVKLPTHPGYLLYPCLTGMW